MKTIIYNLIFGLIFAGVFAFLTWRIADQPEFNWGHFSLLLFGAIIVLGIWMSVLGAIEIDDKHHDI